MALLAPWIAPYSPTAQDYAALADPTPSAAHWLGTDHLGRDLLSRILYGARTVLAIAPLTVVGASILGSLLGLCAGYYRGVVDLVLSRVADIVLSFPVIILYMIILAKFGASAWNIIMVLTLTRAPIIYRIVRGLTLELREREYVSAAKMRGESPLYIMVVEILPNARGPLVVDMCLRIGLQHDPHRGPRLPRHRHPAAGPGLGRHGPGHLRHDLGVAPHGARPVRGDLLAGRRVQPPRHRAPGDRAA